MCFYQMKGSWRQSFLKCIKWKVCYDFCSWGMFIKQTSFLVVIYVFRYKNTHSHPWPSVTEEVSDETKAFAAQKKNQKFVPFLKIFLNAYIKFLAVLRKKIQFLSQPNISVIFGKYSRPHFLKSSHQLFKKKISLLIPLKKFWYVCSSNCQLKYDLTSEKANPTPKHLCILHLCHCKRILCNFTLKFVNSLQLFT